VVELEVALVVALEVQFPQVPGVEQGVGLVVEKKETEMEMAPKVALEVAPEEALEVALEEAPEEAPEVALEVQLVVEKKEMEMGKALAVKVVELEVAPEVALEAALVVEGVVAQEVVPAVAQDQVSQGSQ